VACANAKPAPIVVLDDFDPNNAQAASGVPHGVEVTHVLAAESGVPVSAIRQETAPFQENLPVLGPNGYRSAVEANYATYIRAMADKLAGILDGMPSAPAVISISQGSDPIRFAMNQAGTTNDGNVATIQDGFKTRLGLPTNVSQTQAVQSLFDQTYAATKSASVLAAQSSLAEVVARGAAKGILIAFANQNGQDVCNRLRAQGYSLPGDIKNNVLASAGTINVAASDHGKPSYFSSSSPGLTVIATNGVDVPVGNNATESGTSQATPQVAGFLARLLGINPKLRFDDVRAILKATATPIPGGDAATYGAGELDRTKALAAAKAAPGSLCTPTSNEGSSTASNPPPSTTPPGQTSSAPLVINPEDIDAISNNNNGSDCEVLVTVRGTTYKAECTNGQCTCTAMATKSCTMTTDGCNFELKGTTGHAACCTL
jgi:hypothetical protein